MDVIRWVIADVDAGGAESAYDVVDHVGRQLEKLVDHNEGLPLVTRVRIKGETPAHSELLTNVEHWCNEIRSAAIDSGGRVWVEKVKFNTTLPAVEPDLQKGDGAIGELVSLFDELSANADMVHALSDEFSDIEKKIPKELKDDAESLNFDDVDWLSEILKQVRPLLLQRLLRKGGVAE